MTILFICNRLPYPPDKGERIRSFHILKYLAQKHRIILFSLSDVPHNPEHIGELKKFCSEVVVYPLQKWTSGVRMLFGLMKGRPCTFSYFYSRRMLRDVRRALHGKSIDRVFAYCSSSAQYALMKSSVNRIVDFVDVDSDKWRQYAARSSLVFRFVYTLEYWLLRVWERKIAAHFDRLIVTTESERLKLSIGASDVITKTAAVANGVDLPMGPSVKTNRTGCGRFVFTGQMDYLPNVDAVVYFVRDILPLIRKKMGECEFFVVGRNPSHEVLQLQAAATVTGEVDDVGRYLSSASVYVAPLRLAFGVPNKILEAMAYGVPVVTTNAVAAALGARSGVELLTADTPEAFCNMVIRLCGDGSLRDGIINSAYQMLSERYDWAKNLSTLDTIVDL